ncbi:MAG: twin-arginine translocation signal domain-containing protein, partial [Dysgonamonadaceae bacterium]|nr:twin-arginine translocation signal domain-containing protein [Dysgonamonadaceae bacterium]
MKRRDFFKTSAALGLAALTFDKLQAAMATNTVMVEAVPDMVAVMGGEPAQLLERALLEMGGIGKYVKKGQSIVIKP